MLQLVWQLPCDPVTVPLARRTVDHVLHELGVAKSCRDDVGLAVSEACGNVVRHARDVGTYTVTVAADAACCTVDVVDSGRRTARSALAQPIAEASAEGGRGLYIIRAVMDAVEVFAVPRGGVAIHMVKRLVFGRRMLARNGTGHY